MVYQSNLNEGDQSIWETSALKYPVLYFETWFANLLLPFSIAGEFNCLVLHLLFEVGHPLVKVLGGLLPLLLPELLHLLLTGSSKHHLPGLDQITFHLFKES